MILGALGGCKVTMNFLRIIKLEMLADATLLDKLLDNDVLEMIVAIALFQ